MIKPVSNNYVMEKQIVKNILVYFGCKHIFSVKYYMPVYPIDRQDRL